MVLCRASAASKYRAPSRQPFVDGHVWVLPRMTESGESGPESTLTRTQATTTRCFFPGGSSSFHCVGVSQTGFHPLSPPVVNTRTSHTMSTTVAAQQQR